jgi:eukaryotic-like serine/threonine-protein kinase
MNPTSTRHIGQRIGLQRMIAGLHEQAGRPTDARVSYERGQVIGEKAAQTLGADPGILEEMAYLYQSWGSLAVGTGDIPEATAKYERMRATVARLIEAHPAAPRYRSQLADCVRRVGVTLQASGRADDAIAHYRQSLADLERLEKPTPIDLYDIACCRSLISGAASEPGSGLTAAEGQAEAERAVAGVRRALDAGYAEVSWVRNGDPDLKPIRSRPDFQQLMLDMTFPAYPFANSD